MGHFITIIILYAVAHFLFRVASGLFSATVDKVTGKNDDFIDGFNNSFNGMGNLTMRLQDSLVSESKIEIKEIQVKGLLPVSRDTNVAFVTSVLDCTTEEYLPVVSYLESFQEANSTCYQNITNVGKVKFNHGYTNWVRVGVVIPDLLQTPYSGNRKIAVVLRLIDTDNPPPISRGYDGDNKHPGSIWMSVLKLDLSLKDQGYKEAAESREEAYLLCIKLAVAVSMAEGDLDDSEGEIIKKWLSTILSNYTGDNRDRLKKLFNSTFEDSYENAKKGLIDLESIIKRFNEVAERKLKYNAIELCYEVMAADGKADERELNILDQISKGLDIDLDDLKKIKDQSLLKLESSSSFESMETFLGINPNWDKTKRNEHLRTEFNKWNNRLNSLPDGAERERAQKIIDYIAELRRKNG